MAEIVAHFTNQGVPLVAPGNAPTIRVRRTDTGALVVTDAAMTELGDGNFRYTFVPVATLEYSVRADGDPTAAGQTTAQERYQFGALSGITDERIEADISAILTDTAAIEPLVSTNLDAAVSTRSDFDEAANPVELLDSGGGAGTSAAELVADVEAQLSGTHGGGSWLGGATVDARLTELWRRMALDPANDRVDTPTSIRVPSDGSLLDIQITTVGTTVTQDRQ
jgi:hypothetical protein